MSDAPKIGTHLLSLNLFREEEGVEITVAGNTRDFMNEWENGACEADRPYITPMHYAEGLIVEAAQRMSGRIAEAAGALIPAPRREKVKHEMKVYPHFWPALRAGAKPFEVRRDDRGFQVGDMCSFRLYYPSFGYANEAPFELRITYILRTEDFDIGLRPGYVVLGFGTHPMIDDGK